jgi:hypothetical protein
MSRDSADPRFPRQSQIGNRSSVLRWLPIHNGIPTVVANPDCGPEVGSQLIPSRLDPLPVALAESCSPHQKKLRRVVGGVTQGELLRSLLIRSHPHTGASSLSLHGQNFACVGRQVVLSRRKPQPPESIECLRSEVILRLIVAEYSDTSRSLRQQRSPL